MRKNLILSLALVLVVALSGLASAVEITVWCWDPLFNIYAMEEAAKIYKEINPDVTINIVETPWDDVQTKLTTAVMAGQLDTLPDILLMQDNAAIKNVVNFPGVFYDLTDSGIDFSQFADFKVRLTTVDGRNYEFLSITELPSLLCGLISLSKLGTPSKTSSTLLGLSSSKWVKTFWRKPVILCSLLYLRALTT